MADGVGIAVGAGAGAGALKGGLIGANPALMAATGGLSAPIGAGLGAIIGGTAGGIKRKNAVDSMNAIQAEDPEERAMQRFFARRKRAYLTGTANNLDRSALTQGIQTGVSNAFKFGSTTRGLNALSQMYQQGLMGIAQQGQQGALQYGAQENAVVNNMVQRRLELSLLKSRQLLAESAQQTTEDKQNTGVGLMKGFDELSKFNLAPLQKQITMKTPSQTGNLFGSNDVGMIPVDLTGAENLSGNWF